jgi:2,4-dienoyl-CoA reductase-like NADH-dependent reductase (Old Yellow Enzyme family)
LAPGDLPYLVSDRHPEPISKEGIKRIISAFRDSAERSLTAGFRVVEVHSAHGYLLQEFLSPISNNRTDEYGGSFENRTRLLIEVISAVRSVWPSGNPLFVRIIINRLDQRRMEP